MRARSSTQQTHLLTRLSHRPPNSAALFVTIIIKVPILQIFTMLMGFTLLALEWPLPLLKGTMFHRSLVLRPVFLLMLALTSIFFYQVSPLPPPYPLSSARRPLTPSHTPWEG